MDTPHSPPQSIAGQHFGPQRTCRILRPPSKRKDTPVFPSTTTTPRALLLPAPLHQCFDPFPDSQSPSGSLLPVPSPVSLRQVPGCCFSPQ